MRNISNFINQDRYCQHCQNALYGRSDQRFCNDICRNTFNRTKKQAEKGLARNQTHKIIKIIKRNYEILNSLSVSHSTGLLELETQKYLVNNGFSPRFYTSSTWLGQELWYCVFDYGFRIEGNFMKIKRFPDQAEV